MHHSIIRQKLIQELGAEINLLSTLSECAAQIDPVVEDAIRNAIVKLQAASYRLQSTDNVKKTISKDAKRHNVRINTHTDVPSEINDE